MRSIRPKAAGEYCFKSGEGHHGSLCVAAEATAEDVVYEFDATQLLAAGLDPSGAKASISGQHGTPANGISSRVGS